MTGDDGGAGERPWLTTLLRFAPAARDAEDEGAILDLLGRLAQDRGCHVAVCYLVPASGELILRYTSLPDRLAPRDLLGFAGPEPRVRLDPSSAVARAIADDRPLLVTALDRALRDLFPDLPPERIAQVLPRFQGLSAAWVPIVGRRQAWGSLVVFGPDLSEADLPVLHAVAHQLGVALQDVGLSRTARVDAAELTRLTAERESWAAAADQSEQLHRALVENVQDVIWWTLPEGMTRYVNPRVTEVLGYQPEDLIGRPFFEFVLIEYRDRVVRAYQQVVESEDGRGHFTLPLLARDGRTVWLEGNGINLRQAGQPLNRLAMLRDITERRQLEAELLERTRQVARAEGAMLTARGMAHEINQPLAVLIGTADLLLDQPNLAPELAEKLEALIAAAEQVAKKVRQLNTVVRVEIQQLGDLPPYLDLKRSSDPG